MNSELILELKTKLLEKVSNSKFHYMSENKLKSGIVVYHFKCSDNNHYFIDKEYNIYLWSSGTKLIKL